MEAAANPLSRVAGAFPAWAELAVSVVARLAGAVLALGIAFDQSYDRTELFAPVVALIAAASCIPVPARAAGWVAGAGSGSVFYAGMVLTHLGAGVGMAAAGALAGVMAIAWSSRTRGTWPAAIGFLGAAGLVAVLMLGIFFSVDG
jgi:hypothetical protein